MNKEKSLSLAFKAGFMEVHRAGLSSIDVRAFEGKEDCTFSVLKLIQLVEQATLERAAKVAEDEPKVWDVDAPMPQTRIASKIRALKDSHD